MKKKIYKTRIVVEVLHEDEDRYEHVSHLSSVAWDIEDGEFSGIWWPDSCVPLEGKDAVEEILNQGSDPEFFRMDDDGNEIEG